MDFFYTVLGARGETRYVFLLILGLLVSALCVETKFG